MRPGETADECIMRLASGKVQALQKVIKFEVILEKVEELLALETPHAKILEVIARLKAMP